jgi:hypothetical protein
MPKYRVMEPSFLPVNSTGPIARLFGRGEEVELGAEIVPSLDLMPLDPTAVGLKRISIARYLATVPLGHCAGGGGTPGWPSPGFTTEMYRLVRSLGGRDDVNTVEARAFIKTWMQDHA